MYLQLPNIPRTPAAARAEQPLRSGPPQRRPTGTNGTVRTAGAGGLDLLCTYPSPATRSGETWQDFDLVIDGSKAPGHSSVSFTMDTFQHPMPTMQDAATKAIEEALGATIDGTAAPESDTN
jgi:hypothetical protein